MSGKWTQGKWTLVTLSQGFAIAEANGYIIAKTGFQVAEDKANAQLLLSAPDLAEAVAALLEDLPNAKTMAESALRKAGAIT